MATKTVTVIKTNDAYAAVERRAAEMVEEKIKEADAARATMDATPVAFVPAEDMATSVDADYYVAKQAAMSAQQYEMWAAERAATVLLTAAGYWPSGDKRR